MHDPMTVAHEIRRPWPEIRDNQYAKNRPQGPRWSAYWYLGGKELYFPPLVTIWHNEPGGADSLSVCKWGSNWQWHVRHWSFQIHPVQVWRRRLLTRCTHCKGKSTKKHPVNVSHNGWDEDKAPWWYPEIGLYHQGCSSIVRRREMVNHEAKTARDAWDRTLAQVQILEQTAEDLRYLGEEEAADYTALRARELKRIVSAEQDKLRERLKAEREKIRG